MSVYNNSKVWLLSISLPEQCEFLCFSNLLILLKCNLKVAQAQCFDIPLRGVSCQSLNETLSKITAQLLLLSPLIFKAGYFHGGIGGLEHGANKYAELKVWEPQVSLGVLYWCPPTMRQKRWRNRKDNFSFLSVTFHDSEVNLLDIWRVFQRAQSHCLVLDKVQ